jgi:PAS domain S-box-containing protein
MMPGIEQESSADATTRPPPFFRRWLTGLLSPRHFHYKLLTGTTVAVAVIIFLAGVFLFITVRNHYQDTARAHTVRVMRLSSVIENDLAALESDYRGYLLTHDPRYLEPFQRRRQIIKKRSDELGALVAETPAQRKRAIKAQELVQRWIDEVGQPVFVSGSPGSGNLKSSLGGAMLDQAREILQSLQNEEQIVLNQRMREQDWATQSAQILDFEPKLERAVIEMDKEKRGYLLTGDASFIEGYRRSLADFYTYHSYLSILVASVPEQATLLRDVRARLERWINFAATPEIEARRTGKDVSALLAKSPSDALMRDVQQAISEFQNGEIGIYESRVGAAEHERIWRTIALSLLALLAVALLISSNTYSFVLVRRQISKLSDAEIRIRSMIQSILDGMITVDANGTIRSMNPAAEKMFGCMNNEMLGQKFPKLVPKAYARDTNAPPVPVAWQELAQRVGTTTLAVGRTRINANFPIEISLSEMRIDGATIYVAMIRDVTEQKRSERELAAEKESLAVTLRSIGDGVITTDVQGKVTMINHAAETLTGWDSAEAIGQSLKAVFKISIDVGAQAKANRGVLRSDGHSLVMSSSDNAKLISRDGAERLIEQVASPIRDRKNQVEGVVLVFRDITEREHNASERRKAESLEQLGLLAGGIAHDFNNLLTAIIGNISLASILQPNESEMSVRLEDAKNASMRARDLAQQLLTFARGGAPIKKTASIGKLIQDTVSFSLRGSQSRSEFQIANDLWPAEIDAGQISQVIANLVVNADQAMPDGGTINITCQNFRQSAAGNGNTVSELIPGDYVRIAIKDTGVGIAGQYLKRIFDPYFTTKPKGNGLGLATTYSIIKHHKGLVTVESEPNRGSTFTLYLPAVPRVVVAEELPRKSMSEIKGTGRILVVDDEEAIRELVDFTLSHLGYEVSTAEAALKGVEIYRERLKEGRRFDAVILDLTLPGGMGGREALKRLLEIDPAVNAIVSSGYAMDATMSRYQDYGFRGVIAKPYEAAELGRVVRETILSNHANATPATAPPAYEMQAAG